jgi:hypothetical protein
MTRGARRLGSNLNIVLRRLTQSSLSGLSGLSLREGFRSDTTSTRGSRMLLRNSLDLSTAMVTSSSTSTMEWRSNNPACFFVVGLRTI